MRLYLCVMLALSFFSASALTSEQQTFSDAASWAKQTANQALKPNALPLNIDDYCKDAACKREIRNPKESRLSDSDINSQKNLAFAKDETAQAIQNNFNKGKPDIKNDPAMRFALIGQENAFEITHGISNAYVDCKTGQQCLKKSTPKVCSQPTNTPVPCNETAILNNPQLITGITPYQPRIYQRTYARQYEFDTVTLPKKAQTIISITIPRLYAGLMWVDRVGFYINDRLVYTYISNSESHPLGCDPDFYDCEAQTEQQTITFDPPLNLSSTTIKFSRKVTLENGATYDAENWPTPSNVLGRIVWGHTDYEVSWNKQCDRLIPQCKPMGRKCIEGKETRNIDGIEVTLDCWKYQTLYQCQMADTCQSLPSECETVKTQCSLKQNGVCVEQEVTKNCFEKSCRATQMQCGEQSFCLDGDCYVEEPKLNGNFDKSVAALAGLAEAVKDVGDPPKIFTGKPMKCDKKLAGFNDCCKDSGWGQSLGAKCSEGEKALGKAKEKGLTLYVGQYCAKKVLGVCTRKKRSYCVYDSKLAKIIQEQGSIGQLGKGLGSAKNPTCAAITPEELGQINFEYIDFSEFYPEMHANTNLPNFDEIKKRLQSAAGE
ncbi:type-F conjugative transfer system mating-pair stabilization protein TraN [Vibrio parahaemolyticus]|uniref:type-F conjugative transfer system mating-pair stabilization protein TraN n=1 Tax=Vibrio parahaemolyticus TaxID=670 RepID=UPI002B1FB186|nr:type-F conjugative transfer system mating-pair stabilization protein TraN [Vibrio parahaemolyticus]MEA5351772.1 type-F conjugative transfer system mating-pair stabilization protein TraN [Vibrio parahaemolyticus]